jgi:hypothetical protein
VDENEKFIRENLPSLVAHRRVKSQTGGSDEWTLLNNEIQTYHATPKNIEFTVTFEKAGQCISVAAKIHRATSTLSNIEVQSL